MPGRDYSYAPPIQQVVNAVTSYEVNKCEFTFDSGTGTQGWTEGSVVALTNRNERLKIESTETNGAFAQRFFDTKVGQKYRVSFRLDDGSAKLVKLKIKSMSPLVTTQVLNENFVPEGDLSYEFTATTVLARIKIFRLDDDNKGTLSFFIDNFRIDEIRDTVYNDTIPVPTGKGYRYAFNSIERDDQAKGVGNSYDLVVFKIAYGSIS